jgi:hypothetical protein
MGYYKESENSEHLEIVKGLVTQIAVWFKLDSESTNEPAVRGKKRNLANKTTLTELNQYLQEPAVDKSFHTTRYFCMLQSSYAYRWKQSQLYTKEHGGRSCLVGSHIQDI